MKAFGYQNEGEELVELREVSFLCDIEEIEKIMKFLQEVKAQHSAVINKTDLCHSHFRDWDVSWKEGSVDIIIASSIAT
jgi:hypothetical protein